MTTRYHRKVIRIRAQDSPNVQRAERMIREGKTPDGARVIEGVTTWQTYLSRRKLWDEQRQCVGLDAMFYEGKEVRLFPYDVLQRAVETARSLVGIKRTAKAIGVDTAEGGDKTSICVGDGLGVLGLWALKTPNTDVIPGMVKAVMREWDVPPEQVFLDRGGGGKEHADRMRAEGLMVRTVGFGEKSSLEIKRGIHMLRDRKDVKEEQYVYTNMRAQMYHQLALKVADGYGIPADMVELHRQMGLIPKVTGTWSMWDQEGRIRMLPKQKRLADSDEVCLSDILGCSPDELDSAVLMYYGVTVRNTRAKVVVG